MEETLGIYDDGCTDGTVFIHPRHLEIINWINAYEEGGIEIMEESHSGCGQSNINGDCATLRWVEFEDEEAFDAFITHFGEEVMDV